MYKVGRHIGTLVALRPQYLHKLVIRVIQSDITGNICEHIHFSKLLYFLQSSKHNISRIQGGASSRPSHPTCHTGSPETARGHHRALLPLQVIDQFLPHLCSHNLKGGLKTLRNSGLALRRTMRSICQELGVFALTQRLPRTQKLWLFFRSTSLWNSTSPEHKLSFPFEQNPERFHVCRPPTS